MLKKLLPLNSLRNACAGLLLAIGLAPAASATTTTIVLGDMDCFGLDVACTEGAEFTSLGGSFFTDFSDPGDPFGTDAWFFSTDLGGPSFDFMLTDTANVTSASITFVTAGITIGTGASFLFNGIEIGTYVETSPVNIVSTLSFVISPLLLLDGSNTFAFVLDSPGSDGFIVDYVSLSLTTSPIPLPAGGLLLLSGLAGAAALRRRSRKAS